MYLYCSSFSQIVNSENPVETNGGAVQYLPIRSIKYGTAMGLKFAQIKLLATSLLVTKIKQIICLMIIYHYFYDLLRVVELLRLRIVTIIKSPT